ncbi:hypothetical protein BD847_3085 [Flavobacterium cutihirudinis]|uniref:Uncharacterized protein n=1 Tax=Flavobacterium cutihirudinis TaxID=1265740 RepID=A0A3D9FQ97_9FLAO|nr:hypothetical protein [Flavobacterium cutihirudinis]RED22456.1 hypothetical protein BD847_3085 [Flavobacterium cutihirudinis]
MELKEFISESIKQITDGLIEGHNYIKQKSPTSEGVENGYRKIHFDIGVQSNEGNKDDIGGKITVSQIFQVGGKTESSSSTINTNRIQFDVLIAISHKKYI